MFQSNVLGSKLQSMRCMNYTSFCPPHLLLLFIHPLSTVDMQSIVPSQTYPIVQHQLQLLHVQPHQFPAVTWCSNQRLCPFLSSSGLLLSLILVIFVIHEPCSNSCRYYFSVLWSLSYALILNVCQAQLNSHCEIINSYLLFRSISEELHYRCNFRCQFSQLRCVVNFDSDAIWMLRTWL